MEEVKTRKEAPLPNENVAMKCPSHDGEDLKLFCETCDTVICRDCMLFDHPKPTHDVNFAKNAATNHRTKISSLLQTGKQELKDCQAFRQSVIDMKKKVDNESKEIEEEATIIFQNLIQQITLRQNIILQDISKIRNEKGKKLD